VKPFLVEVSTLTALWRPVLGFGILHQSLPSVNNIAEYKVHLGRLDEGDFNVPHSALLFWDLDVTAVGEKNIRKLLLADEKGDRSTLAAKVRQSGAHVLSTFD
jgi:hypothetical protein